MKGSDRFDGFGWDKTVRSMFEMFGLFGTLANTGFGHHNLSARFAAPKETVLRLNEDMFGKLWSKSEPWQDFLGTFNFTCQL